jgi:hypothetical protein
VLLGGGGVLAAPVPYDVGQSPRGVTAADFDDDGRLDLATANYDSDSVSVLFGKGDGTLAAAVHYPLGDGPRSIASGDFNGDGWVDLAVGNTWLSSVSVLLGDGSGSFQPPSSYPASAMESLAAGDFDADGTTDLAAAAGGDFIGVLLGSETDILRPVVKYPVQSGPRAITTADFNGDGWLDLATANLTQSTASVLLGSGDGTFQPAIGYAIAVINPTSGIGPTSITAGDLNGDGAPDLAVTAQQNNNSVFSLLNRCRP